MQQPERNFYPSLTGIRAIAAWLVFVHHFNFFKESIFGREVFLFFEETHVGVTVFFVLSGLLLTLRYYSPGSSATPSYYNYMVKRFARIYPAFFLILSINFIWLLCTGVFSNSFAGGWKFYLGSVTLLRGFFGHFDPFLIPQSWSLTVEECFYISCPFIFLLIRKNIFFMILLPVLLIGTGLLITARFIEHPFHGFFEDYRFLFNYTFFGRCIEFFAGIGIALLYQRKLRDKTRSAGFTLAGILIMFCCIAGLAMYHNAGHYGDYYPGGILINNFLLPVFGISLLFWGLLTETNIFTRLLSSKLMVLLGKSSYIFYLVHIGFFMTVFYASGIHNPILVFIYLNIISVLLYLGFEKPMNSWIRRKWLKTPVTSPGHAENKNGPLYDK